MEQNKETTTSIMKYLFFILGALLLTIPSVLDMSFRACGLLGVVGFICIIIALALHIEEY